MSNIELVDIQKRDHGSDHNISDAFSATKHHSDPSLDKNGDGEDLKDTERTPSSSVPFLTRPKTSQVARRTVFGSISQWALVFFFPIISLAYLAFCYVVHYRVVPANVSGLSGDSTTQFLTSVGSAITTINIIIISLALFPLKGLLYELKSEEFFRLLYAQRNNRGVDLSAVNGISNSSYGLMESIMVAVNRYCSFYYVLAFIAAVFVWAVSTLAPPALSIQSILIDGSIMAFAVGAIPPLTLYRPVAGGQTVLPGSFSPQPGYSAAVVWAEREIGLAYSFSVLNDSQGIFTGFVVPTPPLLNSTTSARWLTDVIGFNPYCTWANPVNLTTTSLNYTMNSTDIPKNAVTVQLEGVDLRVSVPSSYFPNYQSFFISSINVHDLTVNILNSTTKSLPTDGAMVMSVIQCVSASCSAESVNIISLFIDFSDVPSLTFSSIGADYDIGFLVCKPNITIETREIRTRGSMMLEVQPLADSATPYPRQGNLDWTQTSLLVSYSMSALSTDSGPASSALNGLGSATQADFLFGKDQISSIPSEGNIIYENTTMTLRPLSTGQLAQGYTQMIKATMKPYVSGSLGTSYVPGRLATVQQIFVSSLPHVVASTVCVFLLLIIAVAAHFRPGRGEQFNLTNIAAALAESEFPAMAKKIKVDVMTDPARQNTVPGQWLGRSVGQEVDSRFGKWKVFLERATKENRVDTLHVSRE